MIMEMHTVTRQITGNATPKLSKLLMEVFFFETSFFECYVYPVRGFWFLLATVLFDKLMAHLLTSILVASITERLGGVHALVSTPGMDDDTAFGTSPNEEHMTLLFSPATRYVFFADFVYAGLPRKLWSTWFVNMGLFEVAAAD
jgi:hypothetical protein